MDDINQVSDQDASSSSSSSIIIEKTRKSVMEHDRKFQELLCLIPAKFYIPQTEHQSRSTNLGNKKQKKKDREREIKETREAKRLQKRLKFDPDLLPTIPQIQGLNRTDQSGQNDNSDGENLKEDSGKEPVKVVHLSRSELEAKFKAKFQEIQNESNQKRTKKTGPEPCAGTSKDELLELVQRKRGEMRDKRRRERKELRRSEKLLKQETILKSKAKRKLISTKNKARKGLLSDTGKDKDQEKSPKKSTNESSKTAGIDKDTTEAQSGSKDGPAMITLAGVDAAKRSEGMAGVDPDLEYSSLSFQKGTSSTDPTESQRQRRNPSWISKDPKEARKALERRESYLSKLTPESREKAEESKKWEKANLQASGIKVMDDPKKLERSIKNQKKEQLKRKLRWDERLKTVETSQLNQQKKRNENIAKRQEIIKEKRMRNRKGTGGSTVLAKGNVKSRKKTSSLRGF
ncbi:surfeit locus protein 6-domain-containing protein [Phakopsora pachyrhizi]|uniref:Surfeit locus protein 6-domain-containing protein n=1 Tax=Phakopsora pachyrhizi TaxID=170000 RepID=A0AAV0B1X1_PHAPC|nr:surfeit locus protein 6-domain-containing protein [Phakopsora pachyrhizi]